MTLVEGVWHQSNAKANTAAVVTLDWLRDAGQIQVAEDGTVTVISGRSRDEPPRRGIAPTVVVFAALGAGFLCLSPTARSAGVA
ncbi:hypothetical protein [Nocardia spumae]|uniref:hypothetical protein n=1 Tax=Nocardia spumae TaxID=2887190 RepID=UPI001D15BAF0|nr:hypothetical protein [Nocardia spumae]